MNRFAKLTLVALSALAVGACTSWGVQSATLPPVHARILETVPELEIQVLSSKQFGNLVSQQIGGTPEPQIPTCNIGEEALKSDTALETITLNVGTKEYAYTEQRWNAISKFSDPEKQIALRVLNTTTCERETVIITKRGDQLIAPNGWKIEAVKRISGIRWNNWATQYKIHEPAERAVLFNKYPYIQKSGKSRTITYVQYAGYNQDLHVPTLVTAGQGYMVDLASRALSELRILKVPSLAVPGTLLADTPVAQAAWLARLGPTEHMDQGEFIFDQQWSLQHVLIRIGTNQKTFAALTCSKASACGIMQFTDNGKWEDGVFKLGTYARLRKAYPQAKLLESFTDGAKDPLNAMKAAFIHHDDVYGALVKKFGATMPTNPEVLEELVGAGYNAGTARAISAYQAMLKNNTTDWTRSLPACKRKGQSNCVPGETIGYVEKIRFIRKVWSDPSIVVTAQASD